jgi:outer membrane lipoprotein-sorting protein
MKTRCCPALAALVLSLLISGCSLFPTTRKLPIPKMPLIEQTVAPAELVASLNQRWAALDSLTATVEIQASEIKRKEGIAKGSPTFRGHILMRKPELLRVLGSYLGMRAFDMASDGENFTLLIPSKSIVYKGANSRKKRSANALENLRPRFFFDALAVRGLEPDDLYGVVADTETVEDTARKHLFTVPEYILSISRRKPGSNQLTPVRVITFHRDDLQPYQQDIYDGEGNLETQVFYAAYQNFGSSSYPTRVTIKRPIEELEIVLSVEDVKENQTPALTDDQFLVKIPEGTKVQKLE